MAEMVLAVDDRGKNSFLVQIFDSFAFFIDWLLKQTKSITGKDWSGESQQIEAKLYRPFRDDY